ncbi:MAG TPA: hypothetical protein DGT21_12855 [Armatimonadetes bacterium]|nr:hypothetical protein [Armatimonadota bacterium]
MSFIFDENTPPVIARILRELGYDVKPIGEWVGLGGADEDWIPLASEEGHLIVSSDHRLHKDRAQRVLLREQGITALFVAKSVHHYTLRDKVIWYIKHWEHMQNAALKAEPGTAFSVKANGTLSELDLE